LLVYRLIFILDNPFEHIFLHLAILYQRRFYNTFHIVFIIGLITLAIINRHEVFAAIESMIRGIRSHPFKGSLLLIAAFVIGTISLLPGTLLMLASGFAYGQAFHNTFIAILAGTVV